MMKSLPKCDKTQNLNETKSKTFFDTNFFRYRIRYFFRYQNFPKPIPILFPIPKNFETDTNTIKNVEKFRTRI